MEEKEVLVRVEGLSKKFCKDLKTSLWYGLKDLYSNFRGNKEDRKLRDQEFWAVKDINFELRRGECLGLIGHNGAGKSTLLKILNGLIKPDAGKVTIKGRVGALIELGAGFNPILTGRENIYNNGAVLGFSRKEINEKLEEIIDFAEIRDFIDMPVQNYSSGMKVRLGFAVAAQMEPDVLIIDEVLAVGDLGFVLKCFKTIDKILPRTAIVFVSHSMPMISRISSQILLMEKGESKFHSTDVSKGIDLYYSNFLTNENKDLVYTDNSLDLIHSSIKNFTQADGLFQIPWDSDLVLNFTLRNKALNHIPFITLAIYDKEQRAVAEIIPEEQLLSGIEKNTEVFLSLGVNNLCLSKGVYNVTFTASENYGYNMHYKIHKALTLQIVHDKQIWTPFLLDSKVLETKVITEVAKRK